MAHGRYLLRIDVAVESAGCVGAQGCDQLQAPQHVVDGVAPVAGGRAGEKVLQRPRRVVDRDDDHAPAGEVGREERALQAHARDPVTEQHHREGAVCERASRPAG